MKKICDELKNRILISDGALGTFLQKKGLKPGECPETWNIDRPEDIFDIAKSYIDAGSDMVSTNSFGGNRFKLEHYGLAERTVEINKAAAEIARRAAGKNNWVLGSVGPTGKMLVIEEVTPGELYDCYSEQMQALAHGGADAVIIETMSDLEEAEIAIKAAKENTSLEVICTFTFERNIHGEYRTMMGISPTDASIALTAAGADIIGTNCGNGIERMIEIVKEMRTAQPDVPIMVQANAGLPTRIDDTDVFPETPEQMAAQVPDLIMAGANIIGGCCGTTPEHIRQLKIKS